MADLSSILGATQATTVKMDHSTSTKAGKGLDMTDFLTLMVAMFQNQDIDNTASTTDMMNQMVQMSVVQAITDISTLIEDTQTLTYAASLVGKKVIVAKNSGGDLIEDHGWVTGTGMLNGDQVIFVNDKAYKLSEIMAVGKIPDNLDVDGTDKVENKPVAKPENTDKVENTDKTDNTDNTEKTENTDNTDNTGNTGETGNPVDNPNGKPVEGTEEPKEDGEQREDLKVNLLDHMMMA